MSERLIDRLLAEHRFADAVDCSLLWLEAKRSDPDEYAKVDKGTRFYFLGFAAFESHDYQSATFFFDAAASEDFNHPNPDSLPAHLFMCLDATSPHQAAREIVQRLVQKLERTVDNYKTRNAATPALSVSIVRDHFLRPQMKHLEKHRRTW
jgi:hypothetical protein